MKKRINFYKDLKTEKLAFYRDVFAADELLSLITTA